MCKELIIPYQSRYQEYLTDESKLKGEADYIAFPENKAEIKAIIRQMPQKKSVITIQGGKTGICGGAVPRGGLLLNLSYMNKITAFQKTAYDYRVTVQAGVILSDLEQGLARKNFNTSGWSASSLQALADYRKDNAYFWPPCPTETSATIGGILATNARGPTAYLYGDSSLYVEEITLINGQGEEWPINCSEKPAARLDIGQGTPLPNKTLLELILGSEGISGVIVEATLKLIKKPAEMWGICFFFEQDQALFDFVDDLKKLSPQENTAAIAAVEYFDHTTLQLMADYKKGAAKLAELPDIEEQFTAMLYTELHGENAEDIEPIAGQLLELAQDHHCPEQATWALSGDHELEKIKALRHAAPESINMVLEKINRDDQRITKLATDFSITNHCFSRLVTQFQATARANQLKIAVFGHVPANHLHVNILPQNYNEYVKGKQLIKEWTLRYAAENNIVFSEHGVGKIKRELFQLTTDEKKTAQLWAIKKSMDPHSILNPGNILEPPC